MNYVRLPLQGANNARELGGYPTKDNKVTRFKVFIRSNRLTDITKEDNRFLKDYGVTDIIDLRGNIHIQATFVSDDNIDKNLFNFHYIPLSNAKIKEFIDENLETQDFNFGNGYVFLLENKEKIKEVFKVLIYSKGAVLYHCSAGKDRTGVISALLLGVCGVDDMDIIANYEVTHTYIKNDSYLQEYSENMRVSKSSFIETFIQKLKEEYGTYENYLLSCGITQKEIEMLRTKFLEAQ